LSDEPQKQGRAGHMSIRDKIADDLRAAIEQGKLPPGARLPSEPELAKQYGVSPGTARAALVVLGSEGLVVSSQGRGRTVRDFQPLECPWSVFEQLDVHARGHDVVSVWEHLVRETCRTTRVVFTVRLAAPLSLLP